MHYVVKAEAYEDQLNITNLFNKCDLKATLGLDPLYPLHEL